MTVQSFEDRPMKRSSSALARYEAMLAQAVENHAGSSPTARAAFYDSTRTKLISEMQSGGRSTSIESELRVFDEAVERLEARIKELDATMPEVIKFQPAKSNDWLDGLLDRASSDDMPQSGPPDSDSPNSDSPSSDAQNPAEAASSTSDKWLSELLAQVTLDDVPETQAVSRTPQSQSLQASRPMESSTRRRGELQLASARASSEIAPKRLAPAEGRSRLSNTNTVSPRGSRETDFSRMLEDAMARELEDAISRSRQDSRQLPVEAPLPLAPRDSVEAWARRRKLLLVGGGITTVFGVATGIAVAMYLSMVSAPLEKNADLSVGKDVSPSLQQRVSDAPVAPQTQSNPNGADRPLDGETERLLQRFIQWGQKADGGK